VRNIKYSIRSPLRNRRHCQILDHTLDRILDHTWRRPYCLWHSRVAFLQSIPPRLQELALRLYRDRLVSEKPVEIVEDIAGGSGLVGKPAADNSPGPGFANNHLPVEGKLDSLGCRSPEGDSLHGPTILAEGGHRDRHRDHPPSVPEDNGLGHRASQWDNLNHGLSGDAGTSSEILSEIWNAASNGTQARKREASPNLRGGARNCEVVMP